MIEPGIYKYMSSDDYHADTDSISRSALMDFRRSPRRYWANYLNPERPVRKSTKAMDFGSAFHTLVLEHNLFWDQYAVEPEKMLLKDVGKEKFEYYKRQVSEIKAGNKIRLTKEDFKTLNDMKLSLYLHSKARDLIEGGDYERSYFWEDRHSRLMLKSRPDILNHNCYIDLKTIDDASPHSFQRAMVDHGYHVQAAMVKNAVEILTGERLSACINICVEKKYPYSIGIYIIDELAIETGHMEYKQLCLDLKSCIMSGDWNDYSVEIIGLPKWAM